MASSKSHIYNFALQKYIILQNKHEELCGRLEQIRPRKSSGTSFSTCPSNNSSAPSSPLRRRSHFACRTIGRARTRHGGWDSVTADPLDTILDEETLDEILHEEQRLFDVNESIKRALTELLNCDAVRSNDALRVWAQTRLMDTEKELRFGRRRRSLPCDA